MRSAEAAKNTSGLIEDTIGRIRQGATLVTETNERFDKVSESVTQIIDLIDGIAKSSASQTQGIEDIKRIAADIHGLVSQQ
jgi:methyl-accepting chemotaxis protein